MFWRREFLRSAGLLLLRAGIRPSDTPPRNLTGFLTGISAQNPRPGVTSHISGQQAAIILKAYNYTVRFPLPFCIFRGFIRG